MSSFPDSIGAFISSKISDIVHLLPSLSPQGRKDEVQEPLWEAHEGSVPLAEDDGEDPTDR